MEKINIFDSATPQEGEFFKFKKVGDGIQGTYINSRKNTDGFGNQQTIYIIRDADGKVWSLGFRDTNVILHERMDGIKLGQIVGFRFDEEKESKKKPGTMAKIIRIYADPKLVDKDWLSSRMGEEDNPASYSPSEKKTEESQLFDGKPFVVPSEAKPAGGNFPKSPVEVEDDAEEDKGNEAIDAIRQLATTKGLTAGLSNAGADAAIEQYTGLPMVEENLTKIIIKLTSYKK